MTMARASCPTRFINSQLPSKCAYHQIFRPKSMFSRRSGTPTCAILRPAVCCRTRPRWSHSFTDHILHSKALSPYKTPQDQNTGNYQGGSHFLARDDTIYALSSAPGKAAIAVIRISGPQCHDVRLTRIVLYEHPLTRHRYIVASAPILLCRSHALQP